MDDKKLNEEARIKQLIDSDPELQQMIDELNAESDDEEDEVSQGSRSPFATEGIFYNGNKMVAEVRETKEDE